MPVSAKLLKKKISKLEQSFILQHAYIMFQADVSLPQKTEDITVIWTKIAPILNGLKYAYEGGYGKPEWLLTSHGAFTSKGSDYHEKCGLLRCAVDLQKYF